MIKKLVIYTIGADGNKRWSEDFIVNGETITNIEIENDDTTYRILIAKGNGESTIILTPKKLSYLQITSGNLD